MYLEASMPKMIDEISEKFEQARGKKAKEYATPGAPGKTLKKNGGPLWERSCFTPPRLHQKFATL
jgi:hypothetical protein